MTQTVILIMKKTPNRTSMNYNHVTSQSIVHCPKSCQTHPHQFKAQTTHPLQSQIHTSSKDKSLNANSCCPGYLKQEQTFMMYTKAPNH